MSNFPDNLVLVPAVTEGAALSSCPRAALPARRSSRLSLTGASSNHGARERVAPPRCIIEVSLVSPAEPARSIVRSAVG